MTRTSAGFRYLIYQRKDKKRKRWKTSTRPWTMEWVETSRTGPRTRYRTFPTKGAAQAEADRLDGLARAAAGLADDVKVKDYAARWLHRLEPHVQEGTVRVYGDCLRHVVRWRGEAWLRDLRPAEVKDFLSDLLRGAPDRKRLAKKTVYNVRGVLRAMLNEAVSDQIIATNPSNYRSNSLAVRLTSTRAERRKNIKAMTPEQLTAFLATCVTVRPRRALQFRLMAMTGIRPGEAAALQWDDVDLAGGKLLVRRTFTRHRLKQTKSGEERSVDLGLDMEQALRGWDSQTKASALAEGKQRSDFVFASWRSRGPIGTDDMEQDFKAVLKAAELPPHLTPHCLRHTFASLHLTRERSIQYVQQQLGHASITMTVDTYGHWLPVGNREHANSLEREVAGPPSPTPNRKTTGR